MSVFNGTNNSPLLQNAASPKPYYFLGGRKEITGEDSYERLPMGATEDEFASRPVTPMGRTSHNNEKSNYSSKSRSNNNTNFFTKLYGGSKGKRTRQQIAQELKSNKAAIKIEPKVFFANERTFLAWLHTSVLLAGASIAITSFSEGNLLDQLYGIILLPVAISFLCYAMHQYGRRSKMIRRTAPGPYEDIVGPTVLAIVLIISIIAQFSIKLYSLMYASR
jgi:uncharacterized membrane protein YidH (DUF202 family)